MRRNLVDRHRRARTSFRVICDNEQQVLEVRDPSKGVAQVVLLHVLLSSEDNERGLQVSQEIVDRLDTLIGLYQLANSGLISQARDSLRADPTVACILDETEDWKLTGQLKTKIAKSMSVSEKTVQRRISELVDQKILVATGSGVSRAVKNGGLI